MGDIATEAGVTRTLVNHYFGGKRALYLEVVREAAGALPGRCATSAACRATS